MCQFYIFHSKCDYICPYPLPIMTEENGRGHKMLTLLTDDGVEIQAFIKKGQRAYTYCVITLGVGGQDQHDDYDYALKGGWGVSKSTYQLAWPQPQLAAQPQPSLNCQLGPRLLLYSFSVCLARIAYLL